MFELISPAGCVPAGRRVRLRLRYTHQGPSLEKGASVRLGYDLQDGAGKVQTTNPRGADYLRIETSADAALQIGLVGSVRSITLFPGTGMCHLYVFEINVLSGTVNAGDGIDIVLGSQDERNGFLLGKCCDSPWELFYHVDPSGKYPLGSHHPAASRYREFITPDGKAFPKWESTGVTVALRPGRARYVDLSLPSVVRAGQETQLRVVVYDRFYNHLKNFQGELEPLGPNVPGMKMAGRNFFTGPHGYALVRSVFEEPLPPVAPKFHVPGVGIFKTNPARATPQQANGIFWGDLHGHSSLSDGGRRGADEFFRYARDIRGLDFAALADHSFGLAVKGHWPKLLEAVGEWSQNDRFVALLGYEIMLTSPLGHRNVYFPETRGTLLMADYQAGCGGSFPGERLEAYRKIWDPNIRKTPTIGEEIAALENGEFLWTAHHCGDIADVERRHLALYEACSEWGVSEECYRRNNSTTRLQEVFSRGFSPGLIGASDDHRAKAGFMGKAIAQGAPTPYPSGLTAVVCPSLTRRDIYNALKNKRCYATTGARIAIEVHAARDNGKLNVNLRIAGADTLDRAWVFKNGDLVRQVFLDGDNIAELAWEDPAFAPADNCYIRVSQLDGQVAWINPVPFADCGC